LAVIATDVEEIEHSILPRLQSYLDLALCHHDLQNNNIIYDSATNTVSFIDFDYSQVNYALYDVVDHFGTYAGISNPDYSLYPSREEQRRFLRIYFDERGIKHFDEEKTLDILKCISVLPHLSWFLWCLVQARISKIEFDYRKYAQVQLNMYFKLKSQLFCFI